MTCLLLLVLQFITSVLKHQLWWRVYEDMDTGVSFVSPPATKQHLSLTICFLHVLRSLLVFFLTNCEWCDITVPVTVG